MAKRNLPRKLRDRRSGQSPYKRHGKTPFKYPSKESLAARYPVQTPHFLGYGEFPHLFRTGEHGVCKLAEKKHCRRARVAPLD